MAFAPPPKNKLATTNLAKSTWTPMNNSETNKEVFEERRTIIKKWFEKWHDKQRRVIIEDIFKTLSDKHLLAVHNELRRKFPEERHDFTKRLPRVLSLYVFSFLDPRSLSRCAQVSWYWKYITELDCLWRPKCLKFGWYPTHQPSPYEETVWKRHYIATIYKLHYAKPKEDQAKKEEHSVLPDTARTDRTQLSTSRSQLSVMSSSRRKKATVAPKNTPIPGPKWEPPPWKGSDRHPTDTMRYNYLDNKHSEKNKSKNPRRPKSASGSVLMSTRKSVQSPVKSSLEPRPSSGAPFVKNSSVTQSFDPQALRTDATVSASSERIPVATSRNMMSSSVSNFTYTGSPNLHGSVNGTLEASTYHITPSTPSPMKPGMGGTLNASTYYASALHGHSPVMSLSSPQKSAGVPELSPNMKDASMRPKPVARLSVEKSLNKTMMTMDGKPDDRQFNKENLLKKENMKLDAETPPIKKPMATVSDYKVKDAGVNGKVSPLKGSPWKPQEVISDDSDF